MEALISRCLSTHRLRSLLIFTFYALGAHTLGFAAVVPEISSNVSVVISNPGGGGSFVDNSLNGYIHATPDDLVTRNATFAAMAANGTHVSLLSNNAVGVSGHGAGFSQFGEPTHSAGAGGTLTLRDSITIESGSLASNTPVEIDFSFYALYAMTTIHSALSTGGANNADAFVRFQLNINSSVNGANSIFVGSNSHRRFEEVNASPIFSGMFDPATPQLDLTFNGFVGETFDFIIALTATTIASVNQTGGGNVNSESALGESAVGLAFGATPTNPNVFLTSGLFAGGFPTANFANAANAQMALSAVVVPVPGLIYLFCASAVMLARLRRRH